MDEENRRRQYLKAMQIPVWLPREAYWELNEKPAVVDVSSQSAKEMPTVEPSPTISAQWQLLQEQVTQCTACELSEKRTQTVFGVGDQAAEWMIVGEAPGADEDRQGEPFVGRAGKLLNAMLFAIGLQRHEVYISNIVKCRPPQNRDPLPDEVTACADNLRRQITLIKPKIILTVGRVAAQNLLGTTQNLGALRGGIHRYANTDIPVIVTYHPAYLLRFPLEKCKAWQDLQLALKVLQQ